MSLRKPPILAMLAAPLAPDRMAAFKPETAETTVRTVTRGAALNVSSGSVDRPYRTGAVPPIAPPKTVSERSSPDEKSLPRASKKVRASSGTSLIESANSVVNKAGNAAEISATSFLKFSQVAGVKPSSCA